jgi:D-lyxose ketol-isomerase
LSALEASFICAKENPTGENKQSLLDNANTVQSVAYGLNSFFKVGLEYLKVNNNPRE